MAGRGSKAICICKTMHWTSFWVKHRGSMWACIVVLWGTVRKQTLTNVSFDTVDFDGKVSKLHVFPFSFVAFYLSRLLLFHIVIISLFFLICALFFFVFSILFFFFFSFFFIIASHVSSVGIGIQLTPPDWKPLILEFRSVLLLNIFSSSFSDSSSSCSSSSFSSSSSSSFLLLLLLLLLLFLFYSSQAPKKLDVKVSN